MSFLLFLHKRPFVSEPHSGFRIAFNMFDLDGNQIVDKEEFLVVSIQVFTLSICLLFSPLLLKVSIR